MNEKKVRVGVIGLGRQVQGFLPLYKNHPNVELVAACDISEEKLENAAKEWGFTKLFKDFSICESEDVDMVSIHTPDHLHTEPFIRALESGKHVFVEKPMADNEKDLMRMVEAAKKSSAKTLVGHVLRFNPLFQATKKFIDEGILGRLFYLEGDYFHDLRCQKDQTDPLTGKNWYLEEETPMTGGGIHPFDILRWYTGSDPVEVKAYGNHIAFPEMKSPDGVVSIIKFANGAMAKVAALYGSVGPMGENYHIAVYGTKGTVNRRKMSLSGMHEFMELPYNQEGHPYDPEVEHFIECILENKPTLCDAIDGAKSTMAILKINEAVRTGTTVTIPIIS